MITTFKFTRQLLHEIRADLSRPHAFAHERLGFISAGIAAAGDDLFIVAESYRPVADDDYLRDPSVGAMMGPEAIRKAHQWALRDRRSLFHVHTHGGRGMPGFSSIDLREQIKFVPSFFQVSLRKAHGALVLSDTAAAGKVWFGEKRPPLNISRFIEVGAPIKKWSGS